jgi:hypothetical protein
MELPIIDLVFVCPGGNVRHGALRGPAMGKRILAQPANVAICLSCPGHLNLSPYARVIRESPEMRNQTIVGWLNLG